MAETAATQVTTIQGCVFQRARSANARSAIQKSPGVWMVDVHRGWKRAARRTPTTLAFTPLRDAWTYRLRRSALQNGSTAVMASKPGANRAASASRPYKKGLGEGRTARQDMRQMRKAGRESLSGAISGEKGLLRYPAARHYRIFKQRQHHMSASEDQSSAAVESRKDGKSR